MKSKQNSKYDSSPFASGKKEFLAQMKKEYLEKERRKKIEKSNIPDLSSFEITNPIYHSILIVDEKSENQSKVTFKRLFDVDDNGRIIRLPSDEKQNNKSNNPVTVYSYSDRLKDKLPSNGLFFGSWSYLNNPESDDWIYPIIDLDPSKDPIFIIDNFSDLDLNALIQKLKKGVVFEPVRRMMFRFSSVTKPEICSALYFSEDDFIREKKILKLKPSVLRSNCFNIYIKSIRTYQNYQFLSSILLDDPVETVDLINQEDQVQSLIFNKLRVIYHSLTTLSPEEKSHLDAFIDQVDQKDLKETIIKEFGTSDYQAKHLIKTALTRIQNKLSGEDYDQQLLLELVEHNPEVLEPFAEQYKNEWLDESKRELNTQLENIKSEFSKWDQKLQTQWESSQELCKEVEVQKILLSELTLDVYQYEDVLESLEQEIESKEKVIKQLDYDLLQKVERIKHNASDFLTDLALIKPFFEKNSAEMAPDIHSPKEVHKNFHQKEFETFSGEGFERLEDFMDLANGNLQGIGINERFSDCLSALCTVSHLQNKFILLIGTQASQIVSSIGAALGDTKITVVDGSKSFDYRTIQEFQALEEKTILIADIFQSDYLYHLDSLHEIKDKLIFISTPYFDNLEFITKEIVNHCLPIFIDPLFNKTIYDEKFELGNPLFDVFKRFRDLCANNNNHNRNLISLPVDLIQKASLPRRNYLDLIEIFKLAANFYTRENRDLILISIGFPLYYLLKNTERFKEILDANQSILNEETIQILNFYGDQEYVQL